MQRASGTQDDPEWFPMRLPRLSAENVTMMTDAENLGGGRENGVRGRVRKDVG